MSTSSWAGYDGVDGEAAARANRAWWDAEAADYLTEHGEFLGAADFVWGPEGLREADARLLGDVTRARVLEVGAGAAQCARWLAAQGVSVLATDAAPGMLARGVELDRRTGVRVPTLVADARALPLADATFDVVFTAFGVLPFVADADAVHREVARVLRPGGRWVFSVTHPFRWPFPDEPTERGLTAFRSYFDRTPYVELDADRAPLYAEFHRTLGDHVRDLVRAGFVIDDVVEPEWPAENEEIWGGWGPERGQYLPGTAIFVTHR